MHLLLIESQINQIAESMVFGLKKLKVLLMMLKLMKKEYDFETMKEVKNPYAGKKKAVGINLSPKVIDYFKKLAEDTGVPYQKLIDLYLLDCVKRKKKLSFKWAA